LSAINISQDSASRISPITKRDGRILNASLISFLMLISPTPSRLALQVCIATQSGILGLSSKTSSIVITRSVIGTALTRALSRVVLPA